MSAHLFTGFFQMGYVCRDMDRAVAYFAARHGVTKFRRRPPAGILESAHAWVGETMIELVRPLGGAPPLYDHCIPDNPDVVRLHHHGFRAPSAEAWEDVRRRVEQARYDTPLKGAVMVGELNFLYADTRADLGVFSEFIYLTGAAVHIYDDVPRN